MIKTFTKEERLAMLAERKKNQEKMLFLGTLNLGEALEDLDMNDIEELRRIAKLAKTVLRRYNSIDDTVDEMALIEASK